MAKKELTPVAIALRKLRGKGALECSQSALAQLLGVSLSTVAKWETGQVLPSVMAYREIAKLDKRNGEWWNRQTGEFQQSIDRTVEAYKRRYSYPYEDMLIVPILTSVVAAGPPAVVETLEDEYEGSVAIPLPAGGDTGAMVAARTRGSSMEPLIPDGSLVIIDTRRNKPEENVGYVVAARSNDGITIKILRYESGMYFLVAGNPDFQPQLQPVNTETPWDIAGRVVRWIVEPPAPKGK